MISLNRLDISGIVSFSFFFFLKKGVVYVNRTMEKKMRHEKKKIGEKVVRERYGR